MLYAATIIAQAEERAGIADGDTALRPNLERLIVALNGEARMPAAAEQAVGGSLVARTVQRLEGLRWLRDHPEIADEEIAEPLFLTGLPRSGTTFFQFLFDQDARFRQIRGWEAITPSPPPGADPASAARRRAEESERRRASRPAIPGFDALHLSDEGGPEECHAFLEQGYAAAGFNNIYRVPGYFDALLDTLDLESAYRIHKRQLQLLQWRMPQPRWALKYPNHVLAMPEILRVHPHARFVMTHRDPVQTLASIAKMTFKLRGIRYDAPVDPHEVGRQMLHFVGRHVDRIMEFTGGPDANRVVHVDYYRLLDAPEREMAAVHAALGIETPQAVAAAVAGWHRANPKNARGANDYALEQFGVDADEAAERFAPYTRRFAIPREREGLEGKGA